VLDTPCPPERLMARAVAALPPVDREAVGALGARRNSRRTTGGKVPAWAWVSDQISDRDVARPDGTSGGSGVITAASSGETSDGWDAQACLGCGLVCS
jgi:hypothetical protein